jgi:hypothetical protein
MEIIDSDLDRFLNEVYTGANDTHDKKHALQVHTNLCRIVQDGLIFLSAHKVFMAPSVMTLHDALDHKCLVDMRPSHEHMITWLKEHLQLNMTAEIMHIHKNCSWSKCERSKPYNPSGSDMLHLLLQDMDWLEAIGEIVYSTAWCTHVQSAVTFPKMYANTYTRNCC